MGQQEPLFYASTIGSAATSRASELKATGLPQGRELEILNEVRAEVPPEVFTTEWKNPVNHAEEDAREHLAMAAKLLAEAGYQHKGGVLTNAAGEQLTAEFLLAQPDFERIVLPYIEDLERLGVKASVRTVDTSQYQRRTDTFDFDIIVAILPAVAVARQRAARLLGLGSRRQGRQPQRDRHQESGDRQARRPDHPGQGPRELVAATQALDRVLLWNHYLVPQWHMPFDRLARVGRYRAAGQAAVARVSFLRVWWWDDAAAKRLADGRG